MLTTFKIAIGHSLHIFKYVALTVLAAALIFLGAEISVSGVAPTLRNLAQYFENDTLNQPSFEDTFVLDVIMQGHAKSSPHKSSALYSQGTSDSGTDNLGGSFSIIPMLGNDNEPYFILQNGALIITQE